MIRNLHSDRIDEKYSDLIHKKESNITIGG